MQQQWEDLKAALQRLWGVLVDTGIAGWAAWLIRLLEQNLAKQAA